MDVHSGPEGPCSPLWNGLPRASGARDEGVKRTRTSHCGFLINLASKQLPCPKRITQRLHARQEKFPCKGAAAPACAADTVQGVAARTDTRRACSGDKDLAMDFFASASYPHSCKSCPQHIDQGKSSLAPDTTGGWLQGSRVDARAWTRQSSPASRAQGSALSEKMVFSIYHLRNSGCFYSFCAV